MIASIIFTTIIAIIALASLNIGVLMCEGTIKIKKPFPFILCCVIFVISNITLFSYFILS